MSKNFSTWAKFSVDKSGNVTGNADFRARMCKAHYELFTKFGYDVDHANLRRPGGSRLSDR
jgi:hypothetical protein